MSPDSASSLFPDRPIRPLPKRRLRERLSPDVADTIKYPPAPQNIPPLFAYPYNSKEDFALLRTESSAIVNRENIGEPGQDTGLRRNGLDGELHDNSLIGQARRALVSRPFQDPQGNAYRTPQRPAQARHNAVQPPPSTTSSADGYDSFENTNNKKKRKIPTAGETVLSGTHVLNDSSALGMPSPPTTSDEGSGELTGAAPAPYYQSGGTPSTNPQGISGPGRGRYGRARNGRSPLRTLPDPNGTWSGRTPKLRGLGQYPSPPRATAEKLPMPQGQENISLLQQQTSTKTSPTPASQFTFTFDSQNPVSWPGSDPAPPNIPGANPFQPPPPPGTYRHSNSGTNHRAAPGHMSSVSSTRSAATHQGSMAPDARSAQGAASPQTGAKPKRRGNSLTRAARERRRHTQYQNYLHPPTAEEYWVCEFCEYERIFGHPPHALIRQYEIKDRTERQKRAEQKKSLEKAKSKSRKAKKGKAASKNNGTNQDRTPVPNDEAEEPAPEFIGDGYYHDDVPTDDYADDAPPGHPPYFTSQEWVPPTGIPSRPSPSTQTRGRGTYQFRAMVLDIATLVDALMLFAASVVRSLSTRLASFVTHIRQHCSVAPASLKLNARRPGPEISAGSASANRIRLHLR
ncbi:hypothetical protein DL769_004503 [Monosporascus sp. CRB-8-3]|nr:hypothetical protein DL769_004503 [Monosporascus sp. CRB-8-3]